MANPIVSRTELATSSTPMTISGVIQKTALLLGVSAAVGLGLFLYFVSQQIPMHTLNIFAIGSVFAGIGLGLAISFKPHLARTLAFPYAAVEGVFLAAVTAIFYYVFPSVPMLALSATFVTAAVMLTLYTTGLVQVTEKFRSIITSATIAIMIVYAISLVLRLIFGSSALSVLFDGGMVAIGFSLFVVVIASFNLLLDFDNIERGVEWGVDESYEWVYGVGVLATLVWMYFEIMRLISYFQE